MPQTESLIKDAHHNPVATGKWWACEVPAPWYAGGAHTWEINNEVDGYLHPGPSRTAEISAEKAQSEFTRQVH